MKHILVFLIDLYRLCLSPFLPPTCRYQPTCSRYAIDAVAKYGVVGGGCRALSRLLRCHPWGGRGWDPLK